MEKRGMSLMWEILIHLILIVLIFGLFFFASVGSVGSGQVKRQVLEKQLALMIDSAEHGMVFVVNRVNRNGEIRDIAIKDSEVHVYIEGKPSEGYPIYTKHDVYVEQEGEGLRDKFLIKVE
ncbi:MAG: hypothetical protein ACP5D2_04130 [Candidatus Nanoarchaeia archaeon]